MIDISETETGAASLQYLHTVINQFIVNWTVGSLCCSCVKRNKEAKTQVFDAVNLGCQRPQE